MKILVLFPTRTEAAHFQHPDAMIDFCGVGLTASAYGTLKALQKHQPDIVILAGIAGVYPGSSLKIGDTVLVSAEGEADLGFFTPDGFTHLADLPLDMDFTVAKWRECPHLDAALPLPTARSYSLNAAMAPFVPTAGVDIENMEGAAFFHVCLAENVRFYEVRSISNAATIEHAPWDFDASIRNLAAGLNQLIGTLQTKVTPANSICPQCGAPTGCKAGTGETCWCAALPVAEPAPEHAGQCLCPECLKLRLP